ncbi:pyrroloquinoline quinone biosynthesis protein PqqB [Aureimonas fodinaquatilis]|uniref:Coenzyme PQQ synthesis protein B n=1 Tax=Aureimonas fodinaquatilis TaxID=2565783 RepID=A0A5B0E0W5_9HYPH|nr:pyrroloquinoline quinone biosynthesis protein PqqB [Aureimonas fodinaquatilis]KAA0972717.1 pyrroloquinoline quinone biosynthesis protein PqqB [Aureimonas fodinaquatilis]
MRLTVLGSAAGGGFPQWNCNCGICRLALAQDPRVTPRTQSSVTASPNGRDWLLINASPDLRQQIVQAPWLAANASLTDDARRGSPIGAVLLTNGDVDHIAGLLTLRERQAFTLYATQAVLDILAANPVFQVLAQDFVRRVAVTLDESFEPLPGLEVELFSVPGKVPLYLEGDDVAIGEEGEMTVGVRLTTQGRTAFYIPGCANAPEALLRRVSNAAALLFDGTVFNDDEMQREGVGSKTGRRMGHMPINGEGGSLHAFDELGIEEKFYVHINNTNPILVEGSEERDRVEAAGWRVASDANEVLA